MKTETKNLAALIQLALQKKTFIPVAYAEITAALNALKTALEILPFSNQYTHDVDRKLKQASDVLSGLVYLISNRTLVIKNNSRQKLIDHIGDLHKRVNLCLQQYCNPEIRHYDLLSVSALLNVLADIDKDLKLNASAAQLYELIKPHLSQIQSSKIICYHQWLWWSKFAAFCQSPEIITICKTRLLYLTTQPLTEQNFLKAPLPKINTALSVPQLALFVRVMVETKVLNETNQSAVLKNVAAFTSTSKVSSISSESLRINYYTPNIATKNIIKEYLLQMLRLVNSY